MTPTEFNQARQLLGLSQKELGESLGWSGAKQISNLETGVRPITDQTALAVECLLRRAGKWLEFSDNLKSSFQPRNPDTQSF